MDESKLEQLKRTEQVKRIEEELKQLGFENPVSLRNKPVGNLQRQDALIFLESADICLWLSRRLQFERQRKNRHIV
jgi:hypothetical protein